MSRRCTICGKKSMVAVTRKKLRGKYNPTGKKRKYPNLQWATLESGGRVKACTKCIKTMSKVKKVRKKKIEEKPKAEVKKEIKKTEVKKTKAKKTEKKKTTKKK